MDLSSLIAIPNLDEKKVKEIKILQSVIKTRKTSFTQFLGSEDGSSPGLLIDRLELWIGSCPEYPVISKTNEMALVELVSQMCREAVKARADLCKALTEVIAELTSLDVPADQDQALLQAVVEFNKTSNRIMERTEEWFNKIRVRLANIDIDVDDLIILDSKKEVKQNKSPDIDIDM